MTLDEKQKLDFFHRCYTAVDGLWFMKMEEKYGFDAALEMDEEVWNVMPKIQARKLKKMLNRDNGLEDLFACLSEKLSLEGYRFRHLELSGTHGFCIHVDSCPWYDIIVKAGREHLSPRIGPRICRAEYSVWAGEFGKDIRFELKNSICTGGKFCELAFSLSP